MHTVHPYAFAVVEVKNPFFFSQKVNKFIQFEGSKPDYFDIIFLWKYLNKIHSTLQSEIIE